MSFEYTNLMRSGLNEIASSINITSGTNLMSAMRELQLLRSRNRFPARFQLFQFIESQEHTSETNEMYRVSGPISGKEYVFTKLGRIHDIADISKDTMNACVGWLAEKAASLDIGHKRDMSYYTRVFRALVEKNCWVRYRESDQRYLNRIFTKHYAYEMGHYLGFSLEQMQGFISRVLPDEIYVNKDAEDLVEAYAFNHGLTIEDTHHVLEEYSQNADVDLGTFDVVDVGNTHQLYQEASSFEGSASDFSAWLTERSPLLEGRSRTAFSVYQNLLICAYLMMRALYDDALAGHNDLISELWECCIENGEDMRGYYEQHYKRFHLPNYAQLDWKKAADEFNEYSEWAPSETRERRYPRDFLVYLSIDKNGDFITENIFSRIPLIMKSDRPVQKRDVLCLIWQIYTFAWEFVAPEDVASQLQDFIDLATGILEQCNFMFYLPNLLEYSICRSIIIGGDLEDTYRSVISQGVDSPLCEYLCIRDTTSGVLYGVCFYACEEYTWDDIVGVLYAVAEGEKITVYNDVWKSIELWLTKADQRLQCGWDRVEASGIIEQMIELNRVIDLPRFS